MLKIYMFHYVTKNFDYPHFDSDEFEKVIIKLKQNYQIISLKEFDEIQKNNINNEKKFLMLTFDDGTIDHYKAVYKILKKHKCSGVFFLTSSNFCNTVLDIQIIHKLLSLNDFDEMFNLLLNEINKNNIKLDDFNYDENLDDSKVAIFKQLLQKKLPNNVRKSILNKLIKKYKISTSYDDYYINLDQLQEMKSNNMYFGVHTETHPDLSLLNYSEQYKEIYNNCKILKENNLVEDELLTLSYPYGKYNCDTLKIAKKLKFKYGFKCNSTGNKSSLELDRIDCNELKKIL